MKEDGESSQKRARKPECDSEGVVPGTHTELHYEHTICKSSVYDTMSPASSRIMNVVRGVSCYGSLVPAVLMALLLMCATLQLVLIFRRASGNAKEATGEDCVPGNRSHLSVSKGKSTTNLLMDKDQPGNQCVRFYLQTNETQQEESSGCPPFWISIDDKCYFFSEYTRTNTESAKDCVGRDSRLATVKEATIRGLVTLTGQEFWVGISYYNTQGGMWTGAWADGSMENVTEGIGTCAKLGSRLMLENCYTKLRWICGRDAL